MHQEDRNEGRYDRQTKPQPDYRHGRSPALFASIHAVGWHVLTAAMPRPDAPTAGPRASHTPPWGPTAYFGFTPRTIFTPPSGVVFTLATS